MSISFDEQVQHAMSCIINAEGNSEAWGYPPEIFTPLVVDKAVERLVAARGRALTWKPYPDDLATAKLEAALLE